MDCSQAQNLIEAGLAWDIAPEGRTDERAAFERHLADCPHCAERLAEARELDGDLRRLLAGPRAGAERFADRMAQRFLMRAEETHTQAETSTLQGTITKATGSPVAPSGPAASSHTATPAPRPFPAISAALVASWLAALAAGFLIAVLAFQPWKRQEIATPVPPKPVDMPVARLVVATGNVSIQPTPGADWQSVGPSSAASCWTGASVRTEPGVRCEMQTVDGCVFRMNDDSQVTVRSPRSLDLERGQVWCSAPEDVVMEVRSSNASNPAALKGNTLWQIRCPDNASLISAVGKEGEVRLTAARGEVDVSCGSVRQRVVPGATVKLEGGQFAEVPLYEDALLAGAWIDSLLVRKSPDNPELLARVDNLLAQIGDAKSSYLYEQELRALGEHCVLPLVRYVQSPLSAEAPRQRHKAMRIVSDLAPSWAVGDLISLLADGDTEIRFEAAVALRRLTGESQGREPAAWRNTWTDCTPAYQSWQTWWQDNQRRYPTPEFAKAIALPPKKASYKKG